MTHLGDGPRPADKPPDERAVTRIFCAQNLQSHRAVIINITSLIQVCIALLGDMLFYFVLIQKIFEQARYGHLNSLLLLQVNLIPTGISFAVNLNHRKKSSATSPTPAILIMADEGLA